MPYMHYAPRLRSGVAAGSFAGRFESGAVCFHEWRDNRSPYRVGPSLWVRDGHLSANGQALMDLPLGVWVRFEIVCPLGNRATGAYDLTVTLDGESTVIPQKEFYILYKLLSNPGKVFTKQQLMDEIWGMDTESDPHTLDVHISRLRERFKEGTQFEIVTIRGLGYKAVKRNA